MAMNKNTADTLKGRFVTAIQKSFKPCPLIGDKWFIPSPPQCKADFQFAGCAKLAKAMGMNVKHIAQTIVKNLSLSDMEVSVEITADCKINLKLAEGPAK